LTHQLFCCGWVGGWVWGGMNKGGRRRVSAREKPRKGKNTPPPHKKPSPTPKHTKNTHRSSTIRRITSIGSPVLGDENGCLAVKSTYINTPKVHQSTLWL
jgi:hypothetical protein